MSLSCRPALLCLPPRLDSELLRGVKNLVNRFGVTVGGFFGLSVLERNEAATSLRDFNGDEGRMSWSTRMVERHSEWLSWEEGKGSSAMMGPGWEAGWKAGRKPRMGSRIDEQVC